MADARNPQPTVPMSWLKPMAKSTDNWGRAESRVPLALRAYNGSCMRRPITIAAFFLLLAVPAWAQHGGGHGGGGGHAGFSGGGHAGFSGGGHASGGFSGHSYSGGYSGTRSYARPYPGSRPYSGMRSGVAPSRNFNRFSTSRGPFLHDGVGFRNGFRNGVNLRSRGFRDCFVWRCGGWGLGNSWWGYDPWLWGSGWGLGYDNYDQDYYQNLDIANQMNEQSLDEQRMRQQDEANQDANVRPPLRPRTSPAEDKQADTVLPATVLVFRDQHKEEVYNYAIVGQTLWNFSPQRTERIAVADLDVAATTRANEERGITFRIPAPGQGPAAPPTNMQGQPPAPATSQSSSV